MMVVTTVTAKGGDVTLLGKSEAYHRLSEDPSPRTSPSACVR